MEALGAFQPARHVGLLVAVAIFPWILYTASTNNQVSCDCSVPNGTDGSGREAKSLRLLFTQEVGPRERCRGVQSLAWRPGPCRHFTHSFG